MKRALFILMIASFLVGMPNQSSSGQQGPMDQGTAEGRPLIRLKYAAFDPLLGEPAVDAGLKAAFGNPVKLVHVTGPMASGWILALEERGAVILSYLQDFTYIMALDPDLARSVAALPEVLWIGDFHPAYKTEKGLLKRGGAQEVNILIWPDFSGRRHAGTVGQRIRQMGDVLTFSEEGNSILRARLTSDQIRTLAAMPEVHWIDRYDPPQAAMNLVRDFTGADTVETLGGFDGTDIIGEVKDNGCDTDHPDFGNLIGTQGTVVEADHGTCTFGIVFSDHSGDAKGMLPAAGGVFCDWNESRLSSMVNLKNSWLGLFQSNSWSNGTQDADYNAYSTENDQAVNDTDLTMLYCAGNSLHGVGAYTVSRDSAAKNVICVGAVYHQNTASLSDDQWENHGNGFTPGQGPARDNRIKPDICAVFDDVYTTDIVGASGYDTGDYYDGFGGTSAATPIVAGGVGLIYQMYIENHFDNNIRGNVPHAATVKAMLIANAQQYLLTRATRYQQGWGLLDVEQVYDAGTNQLIRDGGDPLQTGDSSAYQVQRLDGSTPLKIVLCWTDKQGETSAAQALINDLDLKVTAPDMTVYYGNSGLVSSLYSTSGGFYDRQNNVECVFIQSPQAGEYEIEVIGYNIAQDNDPADGVNQDYALVVSECDGATKNSPPILTGPYVTPETGYYGTRFFFVAYYYDEDGDEPDVINVNIDGVDHHMYMWNGSPSDASYRLGNRAIEPDVPHTFYMYAEDGRGGSDRCPFNSTVDGPTCYDPVISWSGDPTPNGWMTVEVWGAVNALWGAAWSRYGGPFYLPASGLTYDVGPNNIHMAKKVGEDPYNLDEFGYASKDFQLGPTVKAGLKYLQATTKMNAYWAKTAQDTFTVVE